MFGLKLKHEVVYYMVNANEVPTGRHGNMSMPSFHYVYLFPTQIGTNVIQFTLGSKTLPSLVLNIELTFLNNCKVYIQDMYFKAL